MTRMCVNHECRLLGEDTTLWVCTQCHQYTAESECGSRATENYPRLYAGDPIPVEEGFVGLGNLPPVVDALRRVGR